MALFANHSPIDPELVTGVPREFGLRALDQATGLTDATYHLPTDNGLGG